MIGMDFTTERWIVMAPGSDLAGTLSGASPRREDGYQLAQLKVMPIAAIPEGQIIDNPWEP